VYSLVNPKALTTKYWPMCFRVTGSLYIIEPRVGEKLKMLMSLATSITEEI
jgi:hypothetical protein